MLSKEEINQQLKFLINETDFSSLGDKYLGKVRDCYGQADKLYIITSDRISCFDKIITSIPFKGQVLTELAMHWFKLSESIAQNHIIDHPDPNVMVVKKCEIFPIEVVVRGYLTGSAWRDYQKGKAISGIKLPMGLKMSQKFSEPIITPSTKAEKGMHDLPISEKEIIDRKIVDVGLWKEARTIALKLFKIGQKEADKNGLILVDTKYEFGMHKGELLLADEIHTLDSSRYWLKETYSSKFEQNDLPDMLDKEVVRQWLIGQNFMGEGEVPFVSDEYRIQIAEHYIRSFEKITGKLFLGKVEDPIARIKKNLGI